MPDDILKEFLLARLLCTPRRSVSEQVTPRESQPNEDAASDPPPKRR